MKGRPTHGRHSCPTIGKVRFREHRDATQALRAFHDYPPAAHVPRRAYECDLCNGWHLTSQVATP